MRQVQTFIRALALLVSVVFVPALLGFAVGGPRAALALGLVAAAGGLAVGFTAERWIARAHGAVPAGVGAATPAGLRLSLDRVISERGAGAAPSLYVFPDPSPNMLVARSLGSSRGAIFLSRGMIPLLSEDELRAVLLQGIHMSGQPGLCLRSLCAVLASWGVRLCPPAWVQSTVSGNISDGGAARELTPFSLLGFLFLFPIIRFLVRLGGDAAPTETGRQNAALDDASRKIRHSIKNWGLGERANPGYLTLYFEYPWPGNHVLSLSPKPGLR